MPTKLMLSLLLVGSISVPVAAQKQQQVDWEAKAMAIELQKLGDPDINMLLPELYSALAKDRAETADASSTDEARLKAFTTRKPSLVSLLNNPEVRREIEMLDSQHEDIQARTRSVQSQTGKQIFALLSNSRDGKVDRQKVQEQIDAIRENARKQIEEAIIPFQFRRLQQLAYHVQMSRQGAVNVITNDPLATELDLTEEQIESLKEASKEIDEELAREIAKLRSRAKEKLFAHLNKDQQKKLSTIIGEEFTYEAVERRKQRADGARPAKQP